MKAVGYRVAGPLSAGDALVDLELPAAEPGPHDLRVAIRAVSVNPADVQMRARMSPPEGKVRVLGFDAAGVVNAIGSNVTLFKPGDEVFYAGAMDRPGTNSELHLVDERVVGSKPKTLSFSEAAALPLTSIAAWELLFERLAIPYGVKTQSGALLIINGAGGVGSILTQLARRLTGLTVIATASRPETEAWCSRMGAHHVINHHRPLDQGLKEIGIGEVRYVAGLTATDRHLPEIAEAIAPHGRLALIDDPRAFDIVGLKRKSVSVHWELMFTPTLYRTPDMVMQHHLLNEVAALVDAGLLRTTLTEDAGLINAFNLKRVHAQVESGRSIGKTVLSGF
ncbi:MULTISPECIES: zinc-binding alcohol dehydrogenase family protein [Bradyrhizobium]|uniref:zinc-binding alcohol dehydrogenase family protein n=1 Tax=Bradyrhizobium TaxID=374 RepID=UPI000231D78B|nr:zinc-binding alcohol dehydrogenase family protein [Bradyrhizobium japonicum]AJA63767.1 NADPH:quinone reductase [Bradyrhizobium japonicum]KMJ95544.1 NADPH:quinone reductase [Bradyrhizobium japonicum]MBR0760266.1 zinc-binding alcohol dehydrogenase family protein [Bradyrhizobium japonicum]MCS3539476.1 zinc-binding alcohol dehydrogenase family protein [Bradyrhizobium japonicum]MCS3993321.1 zinc-binding alcohol dehydrogenase family protein [Bradyrhizobium japonicum]